MSAMEQMVAKVLGIKPDELQEIINGLSGGLKELLENQKAILENQKAMSVKIDAILEGKKDG